jgi:hypothetical protein
VAHYYSAEAARMTAKLRLMGTPATLLGEATEIESTHQGSREQPFIRIYRAGER